MVSNRWTARLTLAAALLILGGSMSVLLARHFDPQFRRVGLQVGDAAPSFQLRDARGKANVLLESLRGKIVLVCFGSSRCPVTADYESRLSAVKNQFGGGELAIIRIDDSADTNVGREIPILVDRDGAVARAYRVQVTPSFYVIDPQGKLRYSGAFDDTRNAAAVQKHFVEDAIRAVRKARPVDISSTQAFGCAIRGPAMTSASPSSATTPRQPE